MNISLNTANPDDDGYIYLYHYTKTESLYDILTNRRLKVTMMGHSNDPLENLPSFKCDDSDSRDVAKFKNLWQEISRDRHQAIVCLSAKCSSMLMWGHYAQGHTGACLVFRFKGFPIDNCMMLPIEYSDKLIQFKKYLIPSHNHKALSFFRLNIDLASHKPREWNYEREFRLFMNDNKHLVCENGSYYTHILSDYLCGVILGAKCPLSIDEVESMSRNKRFQKGTAPSAQKSDLEIIRAVFSGDSYLVRTYPYCDLSDTVYQRLVSRFQESVNNPEIVWSCCDLTSVFGMKINNSSYDVNGSSDPQFYITDKSPFTIKNIYFLGNVTSEIDSTLKTE